MYINKYPSVIYIHIERISYIPFILSLFSFGPSLQFQIFLFSVFVNYFGRMNYVQSVRSFLHMCFSMYILIILLFIIFYLFIVQNSFLPLTPFIIHLIEGLSSFFLVQIFVVHIFSLYFYFVT